MARPDPDRLMAYVDGELDDAARAEVERWLASDPEARRIVAAQQALRDGLARHFQPLIEEPVPARLIASISSNVVPLAPRRRPAAQLAAWGSAAAAMLVLAFFAGRELPLFPGRDTAPAAVIASAPLQQALEHQLASAPAGEVRIGLTFVSRSGQYCRTFEASRLDGIACRGDAGWKLVQSRARAPEDYQYEQAGSPAAELMDAAERMMAGQPFDAEAERQARDGGWRRR